MGSGHRYIAFDLGAESGRAIAGTFSESGALTLDELHRWPSRNTEAAGTRYWDVLYIFEEMKEALRAYANRFGGHADGIGVDTWGVDYGILGPSGQLLQNPVQYRDHRTDGMVEEAFKTVSRDAIYAETGIQFMQINTLYQLLALKRDAPEVLREGATLLLMGDLLHYFLSGKKCCEYTNASTSQLLDVKARTWSESLISSFGLPRTIFPNIVEPGTVLGPLLDGVVRETGVRAPVIAPATHDTAAAVIAAPGEGEDWAYISCGTWSLIGVEAPTPITGAAALAANFTNEGGVGGTIRFLKNIMGLWVFQQARAAWRRRGEEYGYSELTAMASEATPFATVLNVDDPLFLNPADMLDAIARHCADTGQAPPAGPAATSRAIIEGLALRYAVKLAELERCTGRSLNRIHMIGGGIQNELLCQLTADATGRPVIAGPVEATAMGNLAIQHMAKGHLADREAVRRCIAAAAGLKSYEPLHQAAWRPILTAAGL